MITGLIRSSLWSRLAAVVLFSAVVVQPAAAETETRTIRVDVKLRTGGGLDGLVVDHTDHGLVIAHESTPYVFAWSELEPGSALAARRALLEFQRGGNDNLTAEDHFGLGCFALQYSRGSAAAAEFRQAKRLDPSYSEPVREALKAHRTRQEEQHHSGESLGEEHTNPVPDSTTKGDSNSLQSGLTEQVGAELPDLQLTAIETPREVRERVLAIYRDFGDKVREVIGEEMTLVETDHFLIWTDWRKPDRPKLAEWCEAMYAALCRRFDLTGEDSIFLAKCPVFCFRSKARFRRFAQQFDGYSGDNAIGYARSIASNGHVHLVLLRRGRTPADFDRFACTLVHEGTHAFIHRLYTPRLIPHWVNEGCADSMAELVLGDRCPAGENAALLARQYVRYDWPIGRLLRSTGPIDVHEYAIAQSVVDFIRSLGATRFAGFVKRLKMGSTLADALAEQYDGITLDQLEARWRVAVRSTMTDNPESRNRFDSQNSGRVTTPSWPETNGGRYVEPRGSTDR